LLQITDVIVVAKALIESMTMMAVIMECGGGQVMEGLKRAEAATTLQVSELSHTH